MDATVIAEEMRQSFADTPFPEVVKRLAAAGVRSYRADLIRLENTYYDTATETRSARLPLEDPPQVAATFAADTVAAAVHAIQRGAIGYAEFLRRIMRGGCASYCAFLAGRRVIYFGRDGGFHVEDFPPNP